MIGINAQIRSTGGAERGVGFAVPIDFAQALDAAVDCKRRPVSYAYVGVSTENLTPTLAKRFQLPVPAVERWSPHVAKGGKPAASAGLRGGSGRSRSSQGSNSFAAAT